MLGELGTGAGGTGSLHAGESVPRRRGNRPFDVPDPISLPDCKNPKASLVGELLMKYYSALSEKSMELNSGAIH